VSLNAEPRDSFKTRAMTLNERWPDDLAPPTPEVAEWRKVVVECEKPSRAKAAWQLIDTLGPYALLWALMSWATSISWWLAVPLALLAGGFLIRIFIIFHDCGHGSFFRSPRANAVVGFLTGMLVFTPYYHWRWEHALHHGSTGDLDRRGTGDVWTLTVREYLESSRGRRFAYRLSRNPLVLFVLAPLFIFFVRQRFPSKDANRRERRSVLWMNLAILAMAAAMSAVFGFWTYLLLQSIVMATGGAVGVWLFYVQHQFEDAYWERHERWDYTTAALQGSSFYKLPAVLRWFSGNIGYHHVHHLSSRIPNYNLKKCHESSPVFTQVAPMTFLDSLRSVGAHLFDERLRRVVSFGHVRREERRRGGGRRDR
jgi:acyl-lipid omega-6 desaturase (Delta-12 desaturase)